MRLLHHVMGNLSSLSTRGDVYKPLAPSIVSRPRGPRGWGVQPHLKDIVSFTMTPGVSFTLEGGIVQLPPAAARGYAWLEKKHLGRWSTHGVAFRTGRGEGSTPELDRSLMKAKTARQQKAQTR